MRPLITILLLVLSFSIHGYTLVVSDVDDTVRQTNVRHTLKHIIHFFSGKIHPFAHLIDIYNDIQTNAQDVHFFYLTGAPESFDVKKWLHKNNCPEGDVKQKNFFKIRRSLFKYKNKFLEKKVRTILKEHTDLTLLCFGDNTEKDELVYENIAKKFPQIQIYIFIRSVWQSPRSILNPHLFYFKSERELLMLEPIAHLISSTTREKIQESHQNGAIIPSYIRKNLFPKNQKNLTYLQ